MNLIQAHYFCYKLLLDELLLIIKSIINFNLLITHKTLSLTPIILFKRYFKYKIKVETKAHLYIF
jgi:hypothetical protein